MARDFEKEGMSLEDMEKIAALVLGKEPLVPHQKRDRPGFGLGKLDLAKYLAHYGIEYNLKEDGSRKLYRLPQCLFDENHRRNEAAIVQDAKGVITYQCFHDSCKGHIWREARAIISKKRSAHTVYGGLQPETCPQARRAYLGTR